MIDFRKKNIFELNVQKTFLFLLAIFIIKVLSIFNETAVFTEKKGFGVVVNKNDKCIGVITEGDIRRYLITGG